MNDQPEFTGEPFAEHSHRPTEPGENLRLDQIRALSSGKLKRMGNSHRRLASAARIKHHPKRPPQLDFQVDAMLRGTVDHGQWKPIADMFELPVVS